MRLEELRYAIAVVDNSGFIHAAHSLGVAQSAVSTGVAHLEHELGIEIFERQGRNSKLTINGKIFVDCARRVLRDTDVLQAKMAMLTGIETSHMRIGAISSSLFGIIPTAVCEFHETHPHVNISIETGTSSTIISKLRSGEFEMGIIGMSRTRDFPTALNTVQLWRESIVAVVPPQHSLAPLKSITVKRLMNFPLIDFPRGSGIRALSDEVFAEAGESRQKPIEVSDAAAIVSLVKAGVGVGILGARYAEGLPDFVSIPIRSSHTRGVWVAVMAGASSKTRDLMDILINISTK